MDSFEIKGKWQKGFLVTGSIIFHQLEEYKCFNIDIIKGKKHYTLFKYNSEVSIKDKYDISWVENDKKMRMCIQVSQYRGVQIELEVIQKLWTLPSKQYKTYYTITSSLLFKKEVIIERCSFSFEIFTNYKYIYTLLNKEQRKTQFDKIIVYSDGMVFGGNKVFYRETKFDPFKYR